MFADASKQAYAAAVYARIPEEDRFVTHLLFSKAKITKLTANYTIPQLELLAAVIAARAIQYVTIAFEFTPVIRRILWSDSRCVLTWLNTTKILPTFISNRIADIKKIENLEFRHVLNPADAPSRGLTITELQNSIFSHGPLFLQLQPTHWPPPSFLVTHSLLKTLHHNIQFFSAVRTPRIIKALGHSFWNAVPLTPN